MSDGGRSTWYVESLGGIRRFGSVRMSVGISREATLSEDLSEVESRALRGILLTIDSGGTAATGHRLTREAAKWLRERLTEALNATAEFADEDVS